ncbi:ABC-type multidrug transport system ATPase subunit [Microcella putealis]|uniref:ABC-type multidrug transport system ATPase subunit n=2 Tax=Microcella putealis TaxID=337005 RepID=A0A4Q7LSY9_9MICO|nr:ABC-type multidrug transport system ATPase subunit [Microcella putealis]TQM24580.1 ABC-type multidrug transport system ATPase subunit [Microcella putealis]
MARMRFDELTFHYGESLALDRLSASFSSDRIAVLGPNGAGKSTLLSILDTSAVASAGSFDFGGMTITRRTRQVLRETLGVVPQSLAMMPSYTCHEVLAYVCWLRSIPAKWAPRRIAESLAAVGLSDFEWTRVRALSGGMRQRLALAQALVNRPKLLLLDEPTVGLDPFQRAEFRGYLEALPETTVLFATHLVDDVAHIAREVLIIDKGSAVWAGAIGSLVGPGQVSGPAIEQRYIELTTSR